MQTMLDMTPTEALRAATVGAAALLGLDRGTLRPGDVADLVVLDHDIDRPGAFDDPALVVKAGTVVYRRPAPHGHQALHAATT
jgi:imidazolonepropionase-like amidohydrolase